MCDAFWVDKPNSVLGGKNNNLQTGALQKRMNTASALPRPSEPNTPKNMANFDYNLTGPDRKSDGPKLHVFKSKPPPAEKSSIPTLTPPAKPPS